MGACTVHAHAAGKPYRAIVMCPPHLVETWRAELRQVFQQGTIEVHVLEKWRELLSYPRTKPTKPTWLIMGETVAKNGPYWRAAAVKDRRGILRCPDCGAQLREKANGEGSFLSMKDLERSRKRCSAEIIVDYDKDGNPVTRLCRCTFVAIRRRPGDLGTGRLHPQAHEGGVQLPGLRRDSRGESGHFSTGKCPGSPGGLVPQGDRHDRHLDRRQGKSRSLPVVPVVAQQASRPRTWLGKTTWSLPAATGGWIRSSPRRPAQACDNRRSNGKNTTKRQAEQPGIMPTLYGRHLIGNTIFLSLKDVAADLPSLRRASYSGSHECGA